MKTKTIKVENWANIELIHDSYDSAITLELGKKVDGPDGRRTMLDKPEALKLIKALKKMVKRLGEEE